MKVVPFGVIWHAYVGACLEATTIRRFSLECLWDEARDGNRKYGRTVVSIGPWTPPPGGYAGGKISYTRIPSAEDFW
jgi:hypothetical protein